MNNKKPPNLNTLIFISMMLILLAYMPFLAMGERSYLTIGDGLDGVHTYQKLEAQNIKTYGLFNNSFPQPVGGVPRFPYKLPGIGTVLFLLFNPFVADILNRFIISLVAFLGMLILLKHWLPENKREQEHKYLIAGVSLCFSLCGYWSYAGISVAGLPLIYYAFATSDRNFKLSVLIALFYAFYSSLALVGIFLLIVLAAIEIINIITRRGSIKRTAFIFILGLFYLVASIGLVMSILHPLFVSHRIEFDMVGKYPTVLESLRLAIRMFFTTLAHNKGYSTWIIILSLAAIIYVKLKKEKLSSSFKKVYLLYALLVVISFLFSTKWIVGFQKQIPLLGMLQLQRFYWLLIPLQYLIFFETLLIIQKTKFGKIFYVILLLQFGILVYNSHLDLIKVTMKRIIGRQVLNVNYQEFYSKSLFESINEYIGKPQSTYRIVSLGLPPAVALYNGFYTLDGYWSSGYPIEHKNEFGKAMEGELIKNKKLSNTYYNWGSPCYLFSDDIDKKIGYGEHAVPIIRKDSGIVIDNLSIDTNILQSMNCRYVFSSLPIQNHDEIGLKPENTFENDVSPYKIYLYSIIKNSNSEGMDELSANN